MATAIAASYRQPPSGEIPRKGRRSSVSLPALIRLFGRQHSARVHNLSSGGAMIEATAPVRGGDPIALSCGTIEVAGTVVWAQPGRFGLEFLTPIDEEQILRQLDRSNAVISRRALRGATRDD